jgi:hypothetical protein
VVRLIYAITDATLVLEKDLGNPSHNFQLS